ncbi:ferritin-like domain-containing protein [Aminiphilus sp.]|jgi:bacterioferritin|uniref:ferritin-like domain-containing protein n=1 Tax=Aminiphilus sp. TaxID=1872488 RepID=UPI0026156E56|nr:ferritin-like domain-containing protein [Aminiphilus sp.]
MMGTKGTEIVGVNVQELLQLLNKALADEWLAYYQYWIGAKVAKGRMRGIIQGELEEHAQDELRHADMLVERIIQLGGTPLLEPKAWYEQTNCGYDVPSDPNTLKLVQQNIQGEQCAIEVYKKILDFVKDKDVVTYHMALEILEDEVEHEEDLEAILEDMTTPLPS